MKTEAVGASRQKPRKPKVDRDNRTRQARFEAWAKQIDTDKDGKISRAELDARIANRSTAGKPHPFASAVLNNLATLDKLPDDGLDATTYADAAKFLADTFKLKGKKAKKLDTSA
jgi:hypothetical protein